jgi:predicted transcriptional regulator
MVYRKRDQMFLDFLNAAKDGNLRKTEFYHRFGSNHRYFKHFLGFALRKGCVSVDKGRYSLTSKGAKISEEWKNYEKIKEKADEMMQKAESLREEIIKKYGLERL